MRRGGANRLRQRPPVYCSAVWVTVEPVDGSVTVACSSTSSAGDGERVAPDARFSAASADVSCIPRRSPSSYRRVHPRLGGSVERTDGCFVHGVGDSVEVVLE